ncbi:cation channel sperm-associated protein 3-like isoform X8 [Bolinopsis microptera]
MLNTFLLKFVNSTIFKSFIMTIILINTLTTAFYATFSKHPSTYKLELQILEVLDAVFLAIYTIELVLKVWITPRSFFYNGFNCFDFFVLVLSYSQIVMVKAGSQNIGAFKVLRSVRALRPLRSVSFIGGLQVIVTALLTTLRTSFLHIMTLLSIIMFVFGIMGYYMFGYTELNNHPNDWDKLSSAFLSLFVLVTAEGWPTIELELNHVTPVPAMSWSRAYIILFLFIGHFVFSNLFVAVIIGQIDKATSAYEIKKETKHKMDLDKRKIRVESQQATDIQRMLKNQKSKHESETFRKHVIGMYKYMRKDEFTVHKGKVVLVPLWIGAFLQELDRQQKSSLKIINLNHENCTTLGEIMTKMAGQAGDENETIMEGNNSGSFLNRPSRRNGVQHQADIPNIFMRCWLSSCGCEFDDCNCTAHSQQQECYSAQRIQ